MYIHTGLHACTYRCYMQKGVSPLADNSYVTITKKNVENVVSPFLVVGLVAVDRQCLHYSAFVSPDERNMCLILWFSVPQCGCSHTYACVCVLVCKAACCCCSGVLVSPYTCFRKALCLHVCVCVCAWKCVLLCASAACCLLVRAVAANDFLVFVPLVFFFLYFTRNFFILHVLFGKFGVNALFYGSAAHSLRFSGALSLCCCLLLFSFCCCCYNVFAASCSENFWIFIDS